MVRGSSTQPSPWLASGQNIFKATGRDGMTKTILTIDDSASIRQMVAMTLTAAGLDVIEAVNGQDGYDKATTNTVHAVITDLKLDTISGMEVLKAAKTQNPQTEVIMLTGYGSIESAVAAMKAGAIDYLTKPVDTEELTLALARAQERQQLKSEVARLRSVIAKEQKFDPGNIVATSPAMREVLEMVARVA
ncbi:sigma-54-dependent Fis family transcriptional regulator, partial [bacterium]